MLFPIAALPKVYEPVTAPRPEGPRRPPQSARDAMWEGSGSKPAGVKRDLHTGFLRRSTQMDTPNTALRGQDTTAGGRLYMAFELGEKNWKLSLGDGQR